MALPASAVEVEPIPAGERTHRQIALRLLPFLFLLYVTNYIDRTSVAFGALGMSGDLGLSDRALGLAAGLFFLGYVALQIPGAMLVDRWSARRAIALIMITWGCATALTGLIHTASQLYWARLVLGAAEAGFFPGAIVYLSRWFSRADQARATAYFMAAIPFSQAIASPLAGWIVGHSFASVPGWRWLFILEGLPANPARRERLFLPDLPPAPGALAFAIPTPMDGREAARRSSGARGAIVIGRTSALLPRRSLIGCCRLSQLLRRLRILLLVPHHAEASIRAFGCARRNHRHHSLRRGMRRHAGEWMAFRQAYRTALARRDPLPARRRRRRGPHGASSVAAHLRSPLHALCHGARSPSSLLGHSHDATRQLHSRARGGVHQCRRIDCGLCRTLRPGLSELAHGLIHGGHGRRGDGRNRRCAHSSLAARRRIPGARSSSVRGR